MRPQRFSLVFTALLLVLPACDDGGGIVPPPPTIDRNQEILLGWNLFRATDYSGAAIHFARLVEHFPDATEGYVGLGWCEIELEDLPLAIVYFEKATRLADDPDGFAGLAVAASALGRDSLAVEAAAWFTDEQYLFIGDPTLGFTDLVYIRALGQFHLRRYEDCYASLRILRSWLEIDMDAYDFREQLFSQLRLLREEV